MAFRASALTLALLQKLSHAEVCNYPGGECYELRLQKFKDGDMTLHGLWPQWASDCSAPAFDASKLAPIRSEMDEKWPSTGKSNEEFWSHEWSKHGSCTGMDEVSYFEKALAMRDQYASQCDQSKDDCSICFQKDLATVETCSDAPAPGPHPGPHPGAGSCKSLGCGKFDKADPCHCDVDCEKHHNCCTDYDQTCGSGPSPGPSPEASCKTIGCRTKFSKENPCQCNDACEEHKDCCPDFTKVCPNSAQLETKNELIV